MNIKEMKTIKIIIGVVLLLWSFLCIAGLLLQIHIDNLKMGRYETMSR